MADASLPVTIVAIGQNAWGKGDTLSAAVKACKTNVYGRGKQTIIVYRVVGFDRVSGIDGSIAYHSDGACERIDVVTFTKRR